MRLTTLAQIRSWLSHWIFMEGGQTIEKVAMDASVFDVSYGLPPTDSLRRSLCLLVDHPRWRNGSESRHKDGSVLLPPQRELQGADLIRPSPVIPICDSLRSGCRAVGRTREAVDPPDLP